MSIVTRAGTDTADRTTAASTHPGVTGYAATVRGDDGVLRPVWADRSPEARAYYDLEWGRPVRTESGLFELVALLVFAGGLTWSSVLARREALAEAFGGFDPDAVASFDDEDVSRLVRDASMIRNERKIRAVVACARATVAVREAGGLVDLVWNDDAGEEGHAALELTRLPRSGPRSVRLAVSLRAAGFRHVGPVAAQALLLAAGVVRVHREPNTLATRPECRRECDQDPTEKVDISRSA